MLKKFALRSRNLDTCTVQNGALALVDGAHGIGNLVIDVHDLGVDAYATNLHNWLSAPKGTALLWVADTLQPLVKPLVASHGAGLGFTGEHVWSGTSDVSAWLAVPAAIRMHEQLGDSAARKHRLHILEEGVNLLLDAFGCVLRSASLSSNPSTRIIVPRGIACSSTCVWTSLEV
jgi:selenocysteine lyase/cysteine desulfurase